MVVDCQITKTIVVIQKNLLIYLDRAAISSLNNYLGLCDDGLLIILPVTVPIMLWLIVRVVVAALLAASFFLPSAAAFIGS